MQASPDYVNRMIDPVLRELFEELPAIMLTGPRATGKTTSAARIARTVVRLDQPRQADVFRADVDATLRSLPEPILLDEWQLVPDVLGAVKRTVDTDHHAGRFLLAGSARDRLDAQLWPGTGRLVSLSMTGLTRRELEGDPDAPPFLDRIVEFGADAVVGHSDGPDLADYLDMALAGGFPEPLHYSSRTRQEWLAGYIEQLVTRDAQGLDGPRDPVRLRQFLNALAITSAGVTSEKKLHEAAAIDRKTATAYERLLEALFVLDPIPAWSSYRVKRLTKTAKRYLVDPALMAAAVNIDRAGALGDADMLGRIIDTFVVAQLRGELSVCRTRPRLYHLRQDNGAREIDLIVETANQRIIAIEIKADSAPSTKSARHIAWLRDQLGDRFQLGLVFHTGPWPFRLDDAIIAAPIYSIWS